jgi:aminoglycoside 3-N-acetyltransferase
MTLTTAGDASTLDRGDVAADLRALGLPPDETYLIHSSLRRVGPLPEGPKTLLDALRDTCGPRSTIVVPTFTAGNSTTTRAYRRRTEHISPEQRRAEEATIAGFDRQSSPSQNVGAIPEYIRTASGSARSDHPQTSFNAIGPFARELVAVHELECHLGDDSPLRWLYDNDAVVLLIGVGFDVCTCFHLAEYRLDTPPEKRLYRTFVMAGGQRELREFYAPETEDRDFALIGSAMAPQPFVHTGRIGLAPVHWFRMRAGVDFAVQWMNLFR